LTEKPALSELRVCANPVDASMDKLITRTIANLFFKVIILISYGNPIYKASTTFQGSIGAKLIW
jgi:hypothetical protein